MKVTSKAAVRKEAILALAQHVTLDVCHNVAMALPSTLIVETTASVYIIYLKFTK